MAPSKRPLAEVDGNASSSAPKRVSTGSRISIGSSSFGDENADTYESMSKAELIDLLKNRSLPYSGVNKHVLVYRLRCSDEDGVVSSKNPKAGPVELEFVTECRPFNDIRAEKDGRSESEDEADSDEDDDDDEAAQLINLCDDGTCMCNKPIKDYPKRKWIISRQGLEKAKQLKKEY